MLIRNITAIMLLLIMSLTLHAATLIGHWDFEEGSGSNAFDASNNHLDGSIVNASYVAGRVGNYALDFNGSNSYVVIANNALLTPATITISLWYKSRSSQQDHADILDKGHGWNTSPYYAGYAIQHSTAAYTDLGAFYGNGSSFHGASSTSSKDNQWHHLVTTLGQDEISLYIDGTLVSKTAGQGPLVENGQNLYFGRHKNNVRFYNGLIDDVQIYSGTLSNTERNFLYTGVPEPATALFCLLGMAIGFCKMVNNSKS